MPNEGIDFTKNKMVTVNNKPMVDEYWVYTGDDKPRPGSPPITFTRLYSLVRLGPEAKMVFISIGDDTGLTLRKVWVIPEAEYN